MLATSDKNAKKIWVTDFVSEIKRVENYPDFEKLADVIQHGQQRLKVKNIAGNVFSKHSRGI